MIEQMRNASVGRAKAGKAPCDAECLPDLLRFGEVAVLAALCGIIALDLRTDVHLLNDEPNEIGDLLQLPLYVLLSTSESTAQ